MNNFSFLTQWMNDSQKTMILTGAGMSTESGVPDFRSKSGWWKNIDPQTVATVDALENNYDLFHEFYNTRITALEKCHPHAGHLILAKWEEKGVIDGIATQNVDGFHQRAGNKHVAELHGSIHSFRCHNCGHRTTLDSFLQKESCHLCKGKLRPNVVLFGESLPQHTWMNAISNIEKADLVIVIGTSLQVYPVNQLPGMTKGRTVFINLDNHYSEQIFDLSISGSAKDILVQIDRAL